MDLVSSLKGIGLLIAAMSAFALIESLVPLRVRGDWSKQHLIPNLTLTVITFVTNLVYNLAVLFGLAWLQAAAVGLLNFIALPMPVEIGIGILMLDLAWYATHISMHKFAWMWPFHSVHHSDMAVDVTTTVRQHPVEGIIRYVYLAVFGFAVGISPVAFAIYRVWSALHGLFEHANVRLPQWLDTAITFVFSSPNMHRIHHSKDQCFTDRNYSNIFSIWDRLFGTFTASEHGRDVTYGLEGHDMPANQSLVGLLVGPFAQWFGRGVSGERPRTASQ
jgi:sterol desaturase/sphingolipid hydroxylase (fatty acid hydroxylase superfamily)